MRTATGDRLRREAIDLELAAEAVDLVAQLAISMVIRAVDGTLTIPHLQGPQGQRFYERVQAVRNGRVFDWRAAPPPPLPLRLDVETGLPVAEDKESSND